MTRHRFFPIPGRRYGAAFVLLSVVVSLLPGPPAAAATTPVQGWGRNDVKQADGSGAVAVYEPAGVIGVPSDATAVSGGYTHSLALRRDGSVVAWGDNSSVQLGTGGVSIPRGPVPVVGLSDVQQIQAGYDFSLALLSTGSVVSWGANHDGVLGPGPDYYRSKPEPVGKLPGTVRAISAGSYHALALMFDGSVWAWGANNLGQLGDGTTTGGDPRPVPGLADVTAIAARGRHSLALRSDGSVVSWGRMNNSMPTNLTPVPVSGLGGVRDLAVGDEHAVAIKVGGAVVAWGSNGAGQLGDGGTTTSRSSPLPVSGLSGGVVKVAAGARHSLALLADGSVRAWGDNAYGQIGEGTQTARPTPASVPRLASGVRDIAAGRYHSLAVIWVSDTAPPVLHLPADVVAEATSPAGAEVTFSASATDDIDGTAPVVCSPASGSRLPVESTVVSCSATDLAGNSVEGKFTVHVRDTTPPTLNLPADQTFDAEVPAGATVYISAFATDVVDGDVPVTCTATTGVFPLGDTDVECTARDAAGNTGRGRFGISVVDRTAPALALPADIIAEGDRELGAPVLYRATATDGIDGARPTTCQPSPGTIFGFRPMAVVCEASDTSGNTAQGQFNVTVVDTAPPVLRLPDTVFAEATGPDGALVHFSAAADDTVDVSVPLVCNWLNGKLFPIGSTKVICSATDRAGNVTTGSFKVAVQDTRPPRISLPDHLDRGPVGPGGATVDYAVSAVDEVSGTVPVSCDPPPGSTFPLGDTLVTCSATDTARITNTSQATFTVTVQDADAPVLTVPTEVTAEATGPAGAAVSYAAAAADDVDGEVPVSCTPASGSGFALGTTTVACSAADKSGNTVQGQFPVIVRDTTAPQVTVPDGLTLEATDAGGAAAAYETSAVDAVDGASAPSCTAGRGTTMPLGETTVSCSATDAAGNTAAAAFVVRIVDTAAPVLRVPGGLTVEAAGPGGAPLLYEADAVDAVDGTLSPSCSTDSGATLPLGATTVSCAVADRAGNAATAVFTVHVVDSTAPALTLPADLTVEAAGPDGATAMYDVSARDAVDGEVPAACTPETGSRFPIGVVPVQCSAQDGAGNIASQAFTVQVVDSTAPTLMLPPTVTVEAVGPAGAAASYEATGRDTVSGAVPATCDAGPDRTFPLGTTTVSCSASDRAGNIATGAFEVIVQDMTPPAITFPDRFAAEAAGPDGVAVEYQLSATDLVDGDVPVTCQPVSGSTFPLGTTPVSCSAVDGADNAALSSFDVSVHDSRAPVLGLPPEVRGEAAGPDGTQVFYDASASDTVDGDLVASCVPQSGAKFPVGTTDVECSAQDGSGNTTSGRFPVTVEDTTAPAVNVPPGVAGEATGPQGAAVGFNVSANDIVDGDVPPTCSPASGTTFPLGETDVACLATDRAGNASTATFTVTVADTTGPELRLPTIVTVEATGPGGAPVLFTASAVDAVDGDVPLACAVETGTTMPLGQTTVQCSAEDSLGNASGGSFDMSVVDTTGPTLDLPPARSVEAEDTRGSPVSYAAGAFDTVSGRVSAVCSPPPGSVFAPGTTTVRCTATDDAGNRSAGSFAISVIDTTAPDLRFPTHVEAEASGPDGMTVEYAMSARDAVDGDVDVSCAPASGSRFALGDTTVSCSAADRSDNPATGSFVVSIVDSQAPLLTVPTDVRAEATGPAGAVVTYAASAADAVDGVLDVSCSQPSGAAFVAGSTAVECSATDAQGNTAAQDFTVTVADTLPPVLHLPTDVTLDAVDAQGTSLAYVATATDALDGAIAPTCSAPADDVFPLGVTEVDCNATDQAGNRSDGTFTVRVVDSTPPNLPLPRLVTGAARSKDGTPLGYSAAGLDAVDGVLRPSCSPASGSTFPIGMTTVSCSVSDKAGNTSTGTFPVDVRDITPPVLLVPSDITVNAATRAGAIVAFSAIAKDNVDGGVRVLCSLASGTTVPIGAMTVTCTAQDAAGNVAKGAFPVLVRGADEQLADLVAAATGRGPGTVLRDQVEAARKALNAGNPSIACSKLNEFMGTVKTLAGKQLTSSEANSFTADATRIKSVIGCAR